MPLFELNGKSPQIADDAFVAPTASLVGDVVVESGASVWYNAVIRADYAPTIVRAGANVQDGSVIHSGEEIMTEVGPGATIGHLCMVHGAYIGAEALIGNGSTVLDGARIGSRCLVASHSLVLQGAVFEDGLFIAGVPAVAKRPVAGTAMDQLLDINPIAYVDLASRHRTGLRQVG
jgi:carbonic anhydrase/acetyltransferase-like protein (isoleucine patch superfamily)